jgi:HK97 family phage prohead protease
MKELVRESVTSIKSISNEFAKSVSFTPIKVNGRRIIAGYANVADIIDSQNEKMTKEVLTKTWDKFRSNPEFCLINFSHSNLPLGKVVFDPVEDSSGEVHQSGMDERGLYIVSEIRSDINAANAVWKQIENGVIKGYSIAGEHTSPPKIECDGTGECYKVPQSSELWEISVVDSPANKVSLFNMLKGDEPETLFKLSEAVNSLCGGVLSKGVVMISKSPTPDGKYEVFVNTNVALMKSLVKDYMQRNKSKRFVFVDKQCPCKEWVNLFDLSLLRPLSLTKEDLTESIPGGFKDAPKLDEPKTVVDETMIIQDINVSETKKEAVIQPTVVAPIVETPPEAKAPITLEVLAAELAQMKEVLKSLIPKPDKVEGFEGLEGQAEKSEVAKAKYPWDECIADQLKRYGSQERAERICGAIRSREMGKEDADKVQDWDSFFNEISKTEIVSKSEVKKDEPKVEAPVVAVKVPEVVTSQVPAVAPTPAPAPEVKPVEVKVEEKKPELVVEVKKPEVIPAAPRGIAPQSVVTNSDPMADIHKTSWKEIHQLTRSMK